MNETDAQIEAHNAALLVQEIHQQIELATAHVQEAAALLDDLLVYLPREES